MILAIDIGNTNTVLGCIKEDKILFTLRITSDRNKTADEYMIHIDGLLRHRGINPETIDGGILSSVVPELTTVVGAAMEQLTQQKFLVVGSGIKTGLKILTDNPAQLGADLVVDAVASLAKYTPPMVIFDMGTATTMSVINKDGGYMGGMIIPGLRLSVDALSARAAQLPYIHLGTPERLIGTNSIDCMHSGAIYSNAAMLDGLIDRVEEELGQSVTAVATGGLISSVLPFCKRNINYDENLLLYGLNILYKKNKKVKI